MRNKKTLKLSINEVKNYCPFVKNIIDVCKDNDKKNRVVLSIMSGLCPFGKALSEKHIILIDDKSPNKVCKILNESNPENKKKLESLINKKNLIKSEKEDGESVRYNDTTCNHNYFNTYGSYETFQKECNVSLQKYINQLFIDKRYRIFTILRKYRKEYPKVFVENNRLNLPLFYEFYKKYGYKKCIGDGGIQRVSFDLTPTSTTTCPQFTHKDETVTSPRISNTINSNVVGCHVPIDISTFDKHSLKRKKNESVITSEKIVVWCSNDYLCLSNNQNIIEVGIETLRKVGNSSGGTRNISGSLLSHIHLEYILAKWYNKESALLFTSGYIANVGALETLGKLLNLIYVSDELNHASLINGIRGSRCEKHIFKHNDMEDLENILQTLRSKKENENRKIMIVFESVYSMNGHISNIKEIINLAKKYNALTYIDEVHAVGLYGKKGSGYCEELNVSDQIDIINGTLSKSLGSLGGFICANKYFIDVIRSYSSYFIFTTSLTPVNINTSAEAIYIVENDLKLRQKFHSVVKKTKAKLQERGIQIMSNNSHIIPILIKCPEKCKKICDELLHEHQIYLQPINYPTVPKGSERIRVTPCPSHSDEQIERLADSLYYLFKKYKVNCFANEENQKVETEMKMEM